MFNGRVRLQRLVPVVVSVVLLSGCGVAGTQFHPGIAAQVGDEQISTRYVDDVTDGYCSAIETVSGDEGTQQIPLRYLGHEFATSLILEAATKQLAEDYDVEPTSSYRATLAALEPQLSDLSDHERDSVLAVEGAQAYYQDILTTIGAQVVEDEGAPEGTDPDADDDTAAATAGQAVLDEWFASHDVEVNPKYSFAYGQPTQVDTDTSFAVSDIAKAGALAEPDQTYISELPDNLVCGG